MLDGGLVPNIEKLTGDSSKMEKQRVMESFRDRLGRIQLYRTFLTAKNEIFQKYDKSLFNPSNIVIYIYSTQTMSVLQNIVIKQIKR